MAQQRIKNLYYLTHVANLRSILQRGILSHERVEQESVSFVPIYDAGIVSNRKQRRAPNGNSLWKFANLYFQPRNPMLYRVVREKSAAQIAIVSVRADILNRPDIFIANGNAASYASDILPVNEGRKSIAQMHDILTKEWWTDVDGSKRRIMAECLVPDAVEPTYIQEIYVAEHDIAELVKFDLKEFGIPVIPEPQMFFLPRRDIALTPRLHIVDGDMFFSNMQTLTISVNIVGVMGKGLASRAKYQFPDVYVYYQDLCKKQILKMGKPFLYKRETSFDYQLAEDPSSMTHLNGETWFLLFPTKHHWRENSKIEDIEKGLVWVVENAPELGMASLAMPALGCGLGALEWREVGPLMCKYLAQLVIPVQIFLPTEKKVPDELLSKEFLLKLA